MSDPKVIYLGPACEADTGDGRTWAEDDPWPTCDCGHKPVRYVLGEDFDRLTAERDALQLRLNAADQRVDELHAMLTEARQWLGDGKYCDDLPREHWSPAYASLIDRIDAALTPTLGSTCNQIREETGLPIHGTCKACNNSACVDK